MFFNKHTEYGIQAILLMASKDAGIVWTAREVAFTLNLPREFISKILQILSKKGIINSKRGKGGGFYLVEEKEKITLMKIIVALEKDFTISGCLFGFNLCSSESSCPLHNKWTILIEDFKEKIFCANLEEIRRFKFRYMK